MTPANMEVIALNMDVLDFEKLYLQYDQIPFNIGAMKFSSQLSIKYINTMVQQSRSIYPPPSYFECSL